MTDSARPTPGPTVANPWSRSAAAVLEQLAVAADRGLGLGEVRRRRRRFGPNRLRRIRVKTPWRILLDQFESPVVLLLLAASGTAGAFGRIVEAAAIAAALVINAAIGFGTEYSADRSMDALRRLGGSRARVRRNGRWRSIPAPALVPGDIVQLGEGDVVPADLRLLAAASLEIDESALTGESLPVAKSTAALDAEAPPLAERANMAFKGTAVTRGEGQGVTVATGPDTEVGRIAAMVGTAGGGETPLERRLERLGNRLILLVAVVGIIVGAAGILAGQSLLPMIETAIVLAIAAVPEGLPVIATIALGRGMWRMARRNALVKRLSAVETLGATTVILTDKTGTLTENRMTVRRLAFSGKEMDLGEAAPEAAPGSVPHALFRAAALCGTVEAPGESGERGDPMERALVEAARKAGLDRAALLGEFPEVREESFDTDTRMMATVHRCDEGFLVAVKGAPEAVIAAAARERGEDGDSPLAEADRDRWLEHNARLAARGFRLLAVAEKTVADAGAPPYEDLSLIGLVALYDPPRPGVSDAIAACRSAGVRIVMVTGDQGETARAIAREVGILGDGAPEEVLAGEAVRQAGAEAIRRASVFARVSPEDKLTLVEAFHDGGEIVGMTGDGVNDAPALKAADIGIAMGRRGTEVAREAADIVLKDDAFETIVMAIRQGRSIFANIRRFIVFLLSGNLGQILAIAATALAAAPLPLLPLQILFLNLVLDVFPALALGVAPEERGIMRRPPRDPAEPILARGHWLAIAGFGIAIGASVLGGFGVALGPMAFSVPEAVTVAFLAYGFARLWHLFNMRAPGSPPLANAVVRNPYSWAALAVSAMLLLAALYLPGLSHLLGLVAPSGAQWALALATSLVPLLLGQAGLAVVGRRGER